MFLAHDGESFQFLFLFRLLESNGIATETLAEHNVHFADPVTMLRQVFRKARLGGFFSCEDHGMMGLYYAVLAFSCALNFTSWDFGLF